MKQPIAPLFRRVLAVGTAALFAGSAVAAENDCGLCDKEVVIDAELASCFLEHYQEFAAKGGTVVVDLSECASRGIVNILPGPGGQTQQPDTSFLVSQAQLDCLKKKLEDPALVLDPTATIDLESCG